MKLVFDVDKILYKKMRKNGKANGRRIATEARYQLTKVYDDMK